MANVRAVRAVADEFGIPLFFDACRFAENARSASCALLPSLLLCTRADVLICGCLPPRTAAALPAPRRFIQEFEPGFQHLSVRAVVRELFALADGFTISLKKVRWLPAQTCCQFNLGVCARLCVHV